MPDVFDQLSTLQDQMTPEQKARYDALNKAKSMPRRINYPAALDFFENKRATPDEILGGAQEFAKAHMGADGLESVYGVGKVPQDPMKIAKDFAGIVKPYVNLDSVVYQTREQFDARTKAKAEEMRNAQVEFKKMDLALGMGYTGGVPSVEDLALIENSMKTEDFIDKAQEQLLKDDRLASLMGITRTLSPDTLNKARLSAFLADDTAAVSEIAATIPVDERAGFAALIQLSTPAEHNVLKYFSGQDMVDDIVRAGREFVKTGTEGPYGSMFVISALEKGIGRDNLASVFSPNDFGGYGPESYASDEAKAKVREALRPLVEKYATSTANMTSQERMQLGIGSPGYKDRLAPHIEKQLDQLMVSAPALYADAKYFLEAQDLERKVQEALRPRRPDEIGLLFDMTAATMELAPFTAGTALATFAGGPTAGFAFAFSAQKDSINAHYQAAGFDPLTADAMSSAILVPISALEYVGASRFFKTGLAKGLVEHTGRNYWRISGQLLAQRGVGFAEEVLTEGGQRFLEDVVLVAAQEHADIEGLTMEEVMSNAGDEMKAAFKGMAGLMLVPGVRDQGYLALHKLTSGKASMGDVGTFLDLENAMNSFHEQRQAVIDRHQLETNDKGEIVVDLPGPDTEAINIPAGAYDAWKAADSVVEQDRISEEFGASREYMELIQGRETELQDQATRKISEIAFNTAMELNSDRSNKIVERIQSRLDDGVTKDQVLAELIHKYAPDRNFSVVTVNGVEDLLYRDDVSEADKARWTQYRERTGKWPAIEGFVRGGNVFLVNDNLSSPAAAVAKFAHEALGHLGVDAQGSMREDILTEAATILESGGFLQSWAQMLINLNPEFYGPQFSTEEGSLDPLKLADEVIARIAEGLIDGRTLNTQTRSAWQKIRDYTGKTLGIETASEWTDRSMAELVTRLMRGGRQTESRGVAGTRFSVDETAKAQGYIKVYHGTTEDAANRISSEGFKTAYDIAREGGATLSMSQFVSLTPDRSVAERYANETFRGKGVVIEAYIKPEDADFNEDTSEPEYEVDNVAAIKLPKDFVSDTRFSVAPEYDSKEYNDIAMRSVVTDDNGDLLSVFHGTGTLIEEFDPNFTGQGNDQLGSGFYFTTNMDEARGYTTRELNGMPKPGGQDSPNVMEVYLDIRNPIRVQGQNLNDVDFDITEDQAFEILKRSPEVYDIENTPIWNWVDIGDGPVEEFMIRDVAASYTGPSLISMENDFFRGYSTEFRKAVRDVLGYDGAMLEFENGTTHYVAWFPEQIYVKERHLNDTRYSVTSDLLPGDKIPAAIDSLGFYSMVERRISEIRQDVFQPQQLSNQIRKLPGVKKEELDDLGLLDWLDGLDAQRVTKAEVLDFIRQAGPQMREVTLGEIDKSVTPYETLDYAREVLEESGQYDQEDIDDWIENADGYRRNELESALFESGERRSLQEIAEDEGHYEDQDGATKFGEYTLPGGENYREVLLTLPKEFSAMDVRKWYENSEYKKNYAKKDIPWNELTPEAQEEVYVAFQRENGKPDFRSSHFDVPNILAHVRLNDRDSSNGGKILFIEEIQSDWHQAGKKRGYKELRSAYTTKGRELAVVKVPESQAYYPEAWNVIDVETGDVVSGQFPDEQIALNEKYDIEHHRVGVEMPALEINADGVPDAPLKKTESWAMLAFKRVLRQAVEQGYDSVAWTPGDVQNERYDLSKRISRVTYDPNTEHLLAYDLNDNNVIRQANVKPEQVEDYIGKEPAQRLLSEEHASMRHESRGGGVNFYEMEGQDLQVGGEGMKGFYDKILPKAVGKYVKQFGAKVDTGEIVTEKDVSRSELDEKVEVWKVDITPQLKEAVEAGQPRYSVGPAQGVVDRFGLPDPQRDAGIDFAVRLLNGEKVNKERAQRIIDRMYPGANATSALFTAHGLKKQLQGQWEAVRGESLTEAYQLLARTETAMTATQQGIDVLDDARRRFEEQYLKGAKDKEVRDAAEARRREQADKVNALTRDELESEGLWITDPVAQLDVKEETLKPRKEGEDGEDAGATDQQQGITEAQIEEVTEIPQQVDEYIRSVRDAVQVKTGLQTTDPDFLRAYRATLQQALRGSVRALTYSRARESLLGQADKVGDLTTLPAVESRVAKILTKTFQSAAYFDRKQLVRDLERRVRKALGKRRPKVTGSWTKNKLDAAVDRYFRKLRSTKYDIVEEDPETGKTPAGRKLMDLPLEIVEQRIDMIQNELDTGLEAYYKNEHTRKSVSDKISEMQEDLEVLQRYGGLKYKTLAEIQEVFDTTEAELDEALRVQAERKELRNKQMEERSALIIDAVGAARGKLKRSKLEEAKDEWTAYELSLYGRLQDLIRYAEKSDPKTYNALWNQDVIITPEKGIDEKWNLWKLARDIDTASHGIRVRKHEAHKALLDAVAKIYGAGNAFQSEGKIHELLRVREEYKRFSKQDNPVPLSKAHLIQFIAYMDQEWYRENAETYGRLADYDAIRKELSSQDLRLLDWMRGFYAEQRPELSAKKKAITGLGFPADIDPLYMPVSVKTYSGGLAGIHTSLQITPAIMSDRRRHKNDMNENLDVFSIFFDRVHQNAVYLELAETALDVAELFGRKDLQEQISKVYGDKYKDRLYEHLYDVISQKPLTYKAKGTEKFMLAYGAMVMNFNLGPAARQPSSGFAFAFDHGMWEVAKWNLQWLSPGASFNPDHKEFVSDMLKSDQAAARFEGGASYEMAAMFEAEGVTAIKRIFKKYGMAPNKYVDMLTIAYIGSHVYRKYYEQLVAQGSSTEAAKAKAMEWTWSEVERHQQSSFLQNQAPWQRRGGGAQKLMGMFGTTVQQFLAEQNRVIRRAKATGDYRELVKFTFINHVVLPVSYKILDTLFWMAFGRMPDEDEWKEYLALMVMGPMGGKFIFRTIMSYAVDAVIQGRPPYFKDNLVPASGMMRIVGDLTQMAWNIDDPEKLTELILDVTGGLLPPVRLMNELYDNYLSDED